MARKGTIKLSLRLCLFFDGKYQCVLSLNQMFANKSGPSPGPIAGSRPAPSMFCGEDFMDGQWVARVQSESHPMEFRTGRCLLRIHIQVFFDTEI